MVKSIEFTPDLLGDFREAYDDAVAADKEVFIFCNTEVLTKYAYYVLEYLEGKKK